jgi:glycosyltransferase involved in cell wall biosynthesis
MTGDRDSTAPSRLARRPTALVCGRFHPEYSGPSIAFMRLAPRLEKLGLRFSVLTTKPRGVPGRETIYSIDVHRFGGRDGRLALLRFRLAVLWWLIWNRRRYGRIHLFFSGSLTYLVPLLGKILGKKVSFTMTLLDSDDPKNIGSTNWAKLKLRLFQLYDRVIYINPEQARRYRDAYETDEPLVAGSMGIDLDAFRPPTADERSVARTELNLDENALVAAFSGAICIRKGVDHAVELWLKVAAAKPRAHFVMLGPEYEYSMRTSDIYSQVLERIKGAGMESHFSFQWSPPSIDAVIRLLHAADIFLFPSRNEGTPSSVLEAMACGVVPVISPLEGFAGVAVRDDVEGLVLQPEADVELSARRIIGLLSDEQQLQRMAERGRQRVRQYHSQEVAVAALMEAWGLDSETVR